MANSEAWVTLATNDSYCLGALVLATSLRRVGTTRDLVILITPGVSPPMRTNLESVFNLVQEVNVLDSGDTANLAFLTRPELGITFTKLHCWKLTQYTKCVFLDADTLVIQNCDELFQREEFSAAPDAGWPDCFNSGVFVYRPSQETFDRLLAFSMEEGSFDGGDQGLLNSFFRDWATKDISRHLPFIYNMVASAVYSYLPAYRVFGQNVKIVHFIGPNKPWLQFLDTTTGHVRPSPDQENIRDLLQAWWDIFKSEVHQKLLPEMAQEPNATVMEQVQNLCSQFMDPMPPSYSSQAAFQAEDPVDLDNLNVAIRRYPPAYTYTPPPRSQDPPPPHFHEPPPPPKVIYSEPTNHSPQHFSHSQESHQQNFHTSSPVHDHHHHTPMHNYPDPPPQHPQVPVDSTSGWTQVTSPSPVPNSPPMGQAGTTSDIGDVLVGSSSTSEARSGSMIAAEPPTETGTKGLAGVFAQMSLEGAKSTEQLEHESTMRKHAWEQGHIDFLGKDSFDNIFKKIQESMAQASTGKQKKEKTPEKVVKEPSPPKIVPEAPAPEVSLPQPEIPSPLAPAIPASEPAPAPEIPVAASPVVQTPASTVPDPSQPVAAEAPPKAAPLSTEASCELEVLVPVDEPLVTQTHCAEPCVCHPHEQNPDIVAAPMSAELSLEELEEQILAVERAALEKKLGEQKRVAEQKLISERAAAEASAKKLEEEAAKLAAVALAAPEPTPVAQEVKEVTVEETQSASAPPVKKEGEEPPSTVAPATAPEVPVVAPVKEPEAPVAPPAAPETPLIATTKVPEAQIAQPKAQEAPVAAPAVQPAVPTAAPPTQAGAPAKKEGAPAAPPKKPEAPGSKKEEAAAAKPPEPKAPPRKQAGKAWSLSSVSTAGIMLAGISLGTLFFLRR